MKKVYVCSPLRETRLNTEWTNKENAKKYCRFVAEAGELPIAPHIYCTEFLKDDVPDERQLGMEMGIELLMSCRELWVFGDCISDGMAREIELAAQKQMPVKFFTEDCKRRNYDEKQDTEEG